MGEVDLTPVVLREMKKTERLNSMGREDLLLVGSDDDWLTQMDPDVFVRVLGSSREVQCVCGARHPVEAVVFGVSFVVCPNAPGGHVAMIDTRRFVR